MRLKKLNSDCIKNIFFVVFCIAAKDGVLTDTEIKTAHTEFQNIFKNNITNEKVDQIIDEFFSSNKQIEDYLKIIEYEELRLPILKIAKRSASSDGLVFEENVAIQKALLIWDISMDEIDG